MPAPSWKPLVLQNSKKRKKTGMRGYFDSENFQKPETVLVFQTPGTVCFLGWVFALWWQMLMENVVLKV